MKKILVLGGKPIGSVELVQKLRERGYYVTVTDYLPTEASPAKQIADDTWDISTGDIDILAAKVKETGVEGVLTGVHEFNITQMVKLCQVCNLPCYCTPETRLYGENKPAFKKLCKDNGIPVARTYTLEECRADKEGSIYPLIVKPIDGSGSRGFHICNNLQELEEFFPKAAKFSPSGNVLIEEYIPFDSVIIHYTLVDGKCVYCGMSDKKSVKFKNSGASVMGFQTFPSKGEQIYLESLNDKVIKMFEDAGFTNGPVWIEAFFDGKSQFIFNEMGYRFGGSLTFYPVRYFYDIDQMDLMIAHNTGEIASLDSITTTPPTNRRNYCILPIHLKPGIIADVNHHIGSNAVNEHLYAIVPVHFPGDEILEWGSAQQVYAYVHILYDNMNQLKSNIQSILENMRVTDTEGNNMLYTLFNINDIDE